MALQLSDIFPLCTSQGTTANVPILEPYSCRKEATYPTYISESEGRAIFRKRISRPYVELAYEYQNILQYEYDLINSFYRRMKGPYENFYVVDWSTPYKIRSFPSTSRINLYTTTDLESSTGYAGNTILLYNGKLKNTLNKEIHTIDAAEDFATTDVSLDSEIHTNLRTTNTVAYILYSCIFKNDSLKPTSDNYCIEKKEEVVVGHGTKTLYGPVLNVTVTFTLLGCINT